MTDNNHPTDTKSEEISNAAETSMEKSCRLMMRSMIAGTQPTGAELGLPEIFVPISRKLLARLAESSATGDDDEYHDAAYELVERFKLVLEFEREDAARGAD